MLYRYFSWMLLLAGLSGLRVFAQLIQAIYPLPFIPPFQAWHGAVMPYPVLVVSQFVVVLVMVAVLLRVKADTVVPRRWKYWFCFSLGGLYFSFMAFRLLAGLTFLSNHPWFSKSLPAFFHVVLASFILLFGHYIYQKAVYPKSDGDNPVTAGKEQRG